MDPLRFHSAVEAVCPIVSVDAVNGRIDFKPEATAGQRQAAEAAWNALDKSDAADEAWKAAKLADRQSLRQAAAQAIADNDAFLALGTLATVAQMRDQMRSLTRQNTAVIRRLVQID